MPPRSFIRPAALAAILVPGLVSASEFDYQDPKGISAISLALDSPIEPIVGYAKGISGKLNFDPAQPLKTTGRIAVDVSSVQFANDGYTATAQGYALNGKKYPQIFLTIRRVIKVTKPKPNVYDAIVMADFDCHGVVTPMRLAVNATYWAGRAEERTNGKFKGDLLILRTQFDVSRSRQGISEGIPSEMVGDIIKVGVSVVGTHYEEPKVAPPSPVYGDWSLEIEDRDEPLLVRASIQAKSTGPAIEIKTEAGSIPITQVAVKGNRISFVVPGDSSNPAREGELRVESDRIVGSLKSPQGIQRIHGRRGTVAMWKSPASLPSTSAYGFDLPNGTIESRMAFHRVPALQLARFGRRSVVLYAATGVANPDTGARVTNDTQFQAGGMGGPVVNLLALRLGVLGKLDLTKPANRYLKRWKLPGAAAKARVCDLMKSASGLAQWKFSGYPLTKNSPSLVALLKGADSEEVWPLVSKSQVGVTTNSNGINETVLQMVVEDATGEPFERLAERFIFRPLGMRRSDYRATIAGDRAVGHYSSGEPMLDRFHRYPQVAASGLWTTARDFALLVGEIGQLAIHRSTDLVPANKLKLVDLVAGDRLLLGVHFDDDGSIYLGGDSYGYFAQFACWPRTGRGIVVMQNRVMSWRLYREVLSAMKSILMENRP